MASIQTANGTITARDSAEVAAMLDAGLITESEAAMLQIALVGGDPSDFIGDPSGLNITEELAGINTGFTASDPSGLNIAQELGGVATPGLLPDPTATPNVSEILGIGGSTSSETGTQTVQEVLADLGALSTAFEAAATLSDPAQAAVLMDSIIQQGGLLLDQAEFLQASAQFDTTTENALDLAHQELENQVLAIESAAEQSTAANLTNITLQQLESLSDLANIEAGQAGALDLQTLVNQGDLGVVGAQGANELLLQQLLNAGNLGVQGLQNTGDLALQQLLSQGNLASQGLQNQGQLDLQQLLNQGGLAGIQAQGSTAVDIANIQAAINQAAITNANTQFQESLALESQLGLGSLGVQEGQLLLDQVLGLGGLDLGQQSLELQSLLGLGGLGIDQGQLDLDLALGFGGLDIAQGQLDLNALLGTGGLAFDFAGLAQEGEQFQQTLAFSQEESAQANAQFLLELELSQLELNAAIAAQNAATAVSGSNAALVAEAAANELAEFKRQFNITQPEDVRQFDITTQTNLTALLSNQQNQAIANPFGAFALNLLGGNALALPSVNGFNVTPSGQALLPPTGTSAFPSTEANVSALLDPNRPMGGI